MIDSILFACDFSDASERALAYGVDLAERAGASLQCLHVQEVKMGPLVGGNPSPEGGTEALLDRFEERCRSDLFTHLRELGDEQVSYAAERSGAVAPAVVQYAEEHGIDLIVMGTHGRRGARRFFFGSVAEEVLRTAPCPVLATRTSDEQASGAASVDRLVVPIDFSDASRSALRYATQLARVYGAPMTLVHAVTLPTLPAAYQTEISAASSGEIKGRAQSELEAWSRTVEGETPHVDTAVRSGTPVDAILDLASGPDDLVVMATHGLSGIERKMLGSVAEGVLRRAFGPVITARSFPAP